MDATMLNPLTGEAYSANYWTLLEQRTKLPVYSVKDAFLKSLTDSQCVVVVGESGAGKSTQIPQWTVEYERERGGKQLVVCTQPRRAAAIATATRVAEEMDVQLGQQVGYSIRFDDCLSDGTVLKYCTDGMLLRETMNCPLLDDYGVIILDHAHERTLYTDAQLALVKETLNKRSDIKLIVMTSTMESAKCFQKYLGNCSLIEIPATSAPVKAVAITPAILHADLLSLVLTLKKAGVSNLHSFDFITKPAAESLNKAIDKLKSLGALDQDEKLTELGTLMSEFPLEPQQSAALISSVDLNCSHEVLTVISMLSCGPRVFLNDEARVRFTHPDGDHLTLLNVYEAFKKQQEDAQWCSVNDVDFATLKNAARVREQLARSWTRTN